MTNSERPSFAGIRECKPKRIRKLRRRLRSQRFEMLSENDEAQRVRSCSLGAGGRANQVVDRRGRPIASDTENRPAAFCEPGKK
jgi:hypothetical protein